MGCEWLGFCGITPEAQAGWVQAGIGLLAAIATLAAVVVAFKSSKDAISTALDISRRESRERESSRKTVAGGLAAAFTHELWENSTRVHHMLSFIETLPNDRSLAEYIVALLHDMDAPVLEQCIAKLDTFEPEDAKLFAQCITKIVQLRRMGESQERNLAKGIVEPTLRNVQNAARTTPDLLDLALDRAHAISGVVPRSNAPAQQAAIWVGEAGS